MDLKIEDRQVLGLELVNDVRAGYDEIGPFISAMGKIHEDSAKIGFTKRFEKNERVVLTTIWEKLSKYAKSPTEEDSGPSIQKV